MEVANTRIFVGNLPNITENEFRAHFSKRFQINDAKLLPRRRIGYIGLKTPEDAVAAVKYFNKSFMRMSKIRVDLADEAIPNYPATQHLTSRNAISQRPQQLQINPLKRKIGDQIQVQSPTGTKHLKIESLPRTFHQDAQTRANADGSSQEHIQSTTERNDEATQTPAASPPSELHLAQSQLADGVAAPISDQDWIRSRTSRLLGLVDNDDDDDNEVQQPHKDTQKAEGEETDKREALSRVATFASDQRGHLKSENVTLIKESIPLSDEHGPPPEPSLAAELGDADNADAQSDSIRHTGRLFLRNLSYTVREADLAALFEPFGSIQEMHLPVDANTGDPKGFAFVQFTDTDKAADAYKTLDGLVFQGRLLHILPGAIKREQNIDDYSLSQLPLKKQKQVQRKKDVSSSTFRWNSMYMNPDAVMSSISERLGVSKSQLLDPSSSNAAVKQAQAETHIIQESKSYFEENGVDLNAFGAHERSDTSLLVKNFAYGTTVEELKGTFSQFGHLSRILMPPGGTIAIIEFAQADEAKTAFGALSYRKFKDSVLFLEKAPKQLFTGNDLVRGHSNTALATKQDTSELTGEIAPDGSNTSTLFVRNLNFTTTNERFRDTFAPLDGLVSARIKTKPDAKRPGQILSMGFGFLEFKTASQAQAALRSMDGYDLDNHKLVIRASHKGHDAAEARRLEDKGKAKKAARSKIIIKNLPFEISRNDIRSLFASYGRLRAVRVPKKFDNTRKGYAFAEFTTAREAESAMDALSNTHLLGRRLVLEFASGEAEDPEAEIAKMQRKIGRQSNNVALQKLTASSERRKFVAGGDDDIDAD